MMICKADFEEMFPEVFSSPQRTAGPHPAMSQDAGCAARWKDSGSQTLPGLRRFGVRSDIGRTAGTVSPDLARDSAIVASMPLALALAVAWTMLSNRNGWPDSDTSPLDRVD